jgi:hypothetical protein
VLLREIPKLLHYKHPNGWNLPILIKKGCATCMTPQEGGSSSFN